MSTPPVDGIDHVGVVVRDLEAAAARFERLGFTLTRRADHTRPGPDGRPVPAGSSQHSVMLAQGYVEVMAVTDPTAGHMLTGDADRYEGIHILAFATGDADRTYRELVSRGVEVDAPCSASRYRVRHLRTRCAFRMDRWPFHVILSPPEADEESPVRLPECQRLSVRGGRSLRSRI